MEESTMDTVWGRIREAAEEQRAREVPLMFAVMALVDAFPAERELALGAALGEYWGEREGLVPREEGALRRGIVQQCARRYPIDLVRCMLATRNTHIIGGIEPWFTEIGVAIRCADFAPDREHPGELFHQGTGARILGQ